MASWAVLFLCVTCRVASAIMVAPLFSSRQIPYRYRIAFAITCSFALFSLVDQEVVVPTTIGGLCELLTGELLLGTLLGAGVAILFSSILLVGEVLSEITGMRWIFDGTGIQSSARQRDCCGLFR
ncbi:MAG: flagellar biosynthetic protein FliR [Pirellulaceae bacterium]